MHDLARVPSDVESEQKAPRIYGVTGTDDGIAADPLFSGVDADTEFYESGRCLQRQPTSSDTRIRRLEDQIGGLLVSREQNNTHITELGCLIAPHLAEILARAGEAKRQADRFLKLEHADFALGVMCTIAPVQFITFLSRFKADKPGVNITLQEALPDRLCELLIKGDLDIALMARPEGFPAPLRAVELYREPFVIGCSVGHRFATQKEISFADLDGETYLSRINCEYRDVLADNCESRGAVLVRSYRSEREDWILNMVAAGFGVCFLPQFTAIFPGVIGRPMTNPLQRSVCLVSVSGRRHSSPVTAFVNALCRYEWPADAHN